MRRSVAPQPPKSLCEYHAAPAVAVKYEWINFHATQFNRTLERRIKQTTTSYSLALAAKPITFSLCIEHAPSHVVGETNAAKQNRFHADIKRLNHNFIEFISFWFVVGLLRYERTFVANRCRTPPIPIYIYFHFNGRSLFIWISIETTINGHSKIELKYKRFMHLNWTARKIYLFLSIFRSSPSERNLVSGQYSYRWEFWASWRCHTQPFNISEHRASACERTVRLHGQQYEFGAAE